MTITKDQVDHYIAIGYTPATAERMAANAIESDASWVCHFTYKWEKGTDHERSYRRTGRHVGVYWVTSEYSPEGRYTPCERCGVTPW